VWGDSCPAIEEEVATLWFSKFLQGKFHLVRRTSDFNRSVPTKYINTKSFNVVGFADAFPFLLISEESLYDLNTRLLDQQKESIPMISFRPNLIVKAEDNKGIPFMEDTWKEIKIGKVTFIVSKKCTRCKITTVNPTTGKFSVNNSPLETLSTFRKGLLDGKEEVCFGENLIHIGEGEICVGDELEIEN